MLICGERRWRAARLAGLATLPCVIVEGELAPGELLALQLIENALREDLRPIEQARSYRTLMDANGWSTHRLAQELAIEADAPQQIEQVQEAVSSGGGSKAQQIAISSFGGTTAFALGCVLVGYLEFRNRRLNGPEEVNEGLGIRVIGTLPSLTSRHALDPLHPIVAQLTESIDGVRTGWP